MDVLAFMKASEVAIGSLMKTVFWFQPTCTIVMRQIFQCIGRLFHQIEQVDEGKVSDYLEECFKVPLASLKEMPLDVLCMFAIFHNITGDIGVPKPYSALIVKLKV